MPESGEQLQLLGTESVLAAEVAVHRSTFLEHAEVALAELIRERCEFTADALRERVPPEVQPHHPNVLPAIIQAAARRGEIVPVRWEPSTRPSRHASVNRVWIAADEPSEVTR